VFRNPEKLAQGCGADGVVVDSEAGLSDALGAALRSDGVTVIAARIDKSAYVEQFNALREL
jgi:thiamine pyrophosphate-dependent acetolactate synthase large subunit-like protein